MVCFINKSVYSLQVSAREADGGAAAAVLGRAAIDLAGSARRRDIALLDDRHV